MAWFWKKKDKIKDINSIQPPMVQGTQPPSVTPLSGSLETPPAQNAPNDILGHLRECIVKISDHQLRFEAIQPNAHLFDAGYLDSFKSIELLKFIKEKYAVDVSEIQLVGALNNLDALAKFIRQKSSPPSI